MGLNMWGYDRSRRQWVLGDWSDGYPAEVVAAIAAEVLVTVPPNQRAAVAKDAEMRYGCALPERAFTPAPPS